MIVTLDELDILYVMHYFSRPVAHMAIIDVVCGSLHANYSGESC
jgi:hypothetical protein